MKSRFSIAAIVGMGWASVALLVFLGLPYSPLSAEHGNPYGPEPVIIDIKPGSDANAVNLDNKGLTPVAILGTPDFDATTVSGGTVLFAGASPVHDAGHLEDVDGDGDQDWLGHFKVQDTDIVKGDDEACLEAETTPGHTITGCDTIKTVGE